jgi:adenylate kinase
MKFKTVLLFGPPGAGKGTQGKVLGSIPNFFHMACGDVFRSLTVDSALGRKFLEYSSKGELVPDEYTVQLWRNSIEKKIQAGQFVPERDTLVLDGLPRSVPQAELLQDALNVQAVFALYCPDRRKLVERLQRRALRDNRLDDASLQVIDHRLRLYEIETEPVLNFYGEDFVHRIDATNPPVVVLHDLLSIVSGRERDPEHELAEVEDH